ANEMAEKDVLALATDEFTVTVMRQATLFGYSPRMRFDLAVNGMTYGAWKDGVIPLMRDGSQWRPMIHVEDTTNVMCKILEVDAALINGEIFNVGSATSNYQLGSLAEEIATALPRPVKIDWYGDPDHRSYRVNFDKIAKILQWETSYTAADGARQLYDLLEEGKVKRSAETITLNWYKKLMKRKEIVL